MLKTPSSRSAGRRRLAVGIAVLAVALGLGAAPAARAVEVPTLFTAEVPLDREADNPREDAYELALSEVLLRVSGSELGNDPAAIAELFPNPSSYVIQFRPGANDTLWVSFDGEAIEQVLRNSGQLVLGRGSPADGGLAGCGLGAG